MTQARLNRSKHFLLALLASLSIWLVVNLSAEKTIQVEAKVVAHSTLVGHSDVSGESTVVNAYLRASGFRHIKLAMRNRRTVDVQIDPEDLVQRGKEIFSISPNSLSKYVSDIYGSGVSLVSVTRDWVDFRFPEENYKKVPLVASLQLRYRNQYMAGGPVSLSPDSVYVYGDPKLLEGINQVLTQDISGYDIHKSLHGSIALIPPTGTRLSTGKASYGLDVYRYVESHEKVQVGVRNVPEGRSVLVYPSLVNVTYRLRFPMSGNPNSLAEFYIDYDDYEASIHGRCMVKAEGVTALSWKVEPEFCECIECD